MKLPMWRCDGPKCEKKFDPSGGCTVEFRLREYKDISTGDWDTDIKRADLCSSCLNRLLQEALKALPVEERTNLAAVWGAQG